MVRFETSNGLLMVKCSPLNFQEQFTYADNTGDKFYSIAIGNMAECYTCNYFPKEGVVKISNLAYSKDEVFVFKVDGFETASKLALSFALGMGFEKDLIDTIYTL